MSSFSHVLLPGLWLAWLIYWAVASRGVKQTQRHESAASRLSHHIPLIAGAIALAIPGILGATLEENFVPYTEGWRLLGTVLVALGLSFAVAARAWLGGNWSSTVTLKRDHELIRSGPYRLVRHPIYTGLLVAIAGTAITLGTWRALIGFALIAVSLVRKLTIEECFMAEQFGEQYARYRAEVKALVPFVW